MVADGDKGQWFKAHWDFTTKRWTWSLINHLASGDVRLDDCGRVQGVDPNFGSAVSDGKSEKEPKTANWTYGPDTIYSPLYGAVIFVCGNMTISGNPGCLNSIDFKCSGRTGCSSSVLPKGLW